jgi:hypothetical protein
VTRDEANVVFEKSGFNFELQLLEEPRRKKKKKKKKKKWPSEELIAPSKS